MHGSLSAVEEWCRFRYAILNKTPHKNLLATFFRRHEIAMALVAQRAQKFIPPASQTVEHSPASTSEAQDPASLEEGHATEDCSASDSGPSESSDAVATGARDGGDCSTSNTPELSEAAGVDGGRAGHVRDDHIAHEQQLRWAQQKPRRAMFAVQPDETFERWLQRLCGSLPKLGAQPRSVPVVNKNGTISMHIPYQQITRVPQILEGTNRVAFQVQSYLFDSKLVNPKDR
jgi:hypothetical protein